MVLSTALIRGAHELFQQSFRYIILCFIINKGTDARTWCKRSTCVHVNISVWVRLCVCLVGGGGTTCDYNCRILACGRCTLVKYTQSQWEYWQAWVDRTQSQTLRCMYYTTTQTHCITLDALFQQMLSHVLWRYILTDYPTTIHTILSLCMCVSFCMSARCYTWFFTFFFFFTHHTLVPVSATTAKLCTCYNKWYVQFVLSDWYSRHVRSA